MTSDTIAAQATAPGRGGVGIIRISGPNVADIAEKILGFLPTPRKAEYVPFHNEDKQVIDEGIALFFKAPNSFTGEDVLELQGHGGPVVMDMLLSAITKVSSARIAKPGEFTERAFLNDKLDLTQAEAIADLIDSTSEHAARSALNALQGTFSNHINSLVEKVIHLRTYVEAAIDFPDEEIDFLSDNRITDNLVGIESSLNTVLQSAKQGAIIREGMKVVIAGKPNAGKSSLLNTLAGKDSAIVTDIAGTTRDVLREHIHLDGMPLHIIDTAGLRESEDIVEKIGIQRAWEEIRQADRILFIVDSSTDNSVAPGDFWPEFNAPDSQSLPITIVRNKADLTSNLPTLDQYDDIPVFTISAKTAQGINELKTHLKTCMGYQSNTEGTFIARRRHLVALENAQSHLNQGKEQLEMHMAGELLAEELRLVQQALNEITGAFTADDLLTEIFSSFCIGK